MLCYRWYYGFRTEKGIIIIFITCLYELYQTKMIVHIRKVCFLLYGTPFLYEPTSTRYI